MCLKVVLGGLDFGKREGFFSSRHCVVEVIANRQLHHLALRPFSKPIRYLLLYAQMLLSFVEWSHLNIQRIAKMTPMQTIQMTPSSWEKRVTARTLSKSFAPIACPTSAVVAVARPMAGSHVTPPALKVIRCAAKTVVPRDFDRVRAVTRFSQLLGVIWMVSIGVIFAFTARLVAGAFTTDDVIVEAAAGGLYAFVPALPLFAYNMITSGALRGTGDTTFPMINQVTTTWCVTMPCVWIFSTYLDWGLMGACLAFAVSSSINCAVLTYRFGREYWRTRTPGPTIVPEVFTHAGE
ncbi:MAG: hypothetical protein EB039_10770 [Proteobacteria bacterium]|nr:hypothetical protein [Pseudomonadota bacterium]